MNKPRRFVARALPLIALLFPLTLQAQPQVVESANSFDETVSKLKSAIQSNQLAIVFEANHKNMIAMVGGQSPNSITIGFGRPQMGQMLMSAEPLAALEMPMRIAVRELTTGKTVLIYHKPSELFNQYRNPQLENLGANMDRMVAMLVEAATK